MFDLPAPLVLLLPVVTGLGLAALLLLILRLLRGSARVRVLGPAYVAAALLLGAALLVGWAISASTC